MSLFLALGVLKFVRDGDNIIMLGEYKCLKCFEILLRFI